MQEVEKYKIIYADTQKYGPYGHKSHGDKYFEEIMKYNSVLDVGCGHNELMIRCRSEGKHKDAFMGIDIACESADVVADIQTASLGVIPFALVTAFDVLEHLPTSEIDQALEKMSQAGKEFMFTISFRDDLYRVEGEMTHLTIKSWAWWRERIMKYAKTCDVSVETVDGIDIDGYFRGVWRV